MAFFNDLVRVIAEAEGMDEITVTGIGQYVRDAGFITKGGRGRSAALMTAADAANLLIGVNAAGKAKDAAEAVSRYSELQLTHDMADAPWAPAGAAGVAGYADQFWDVVMPKGCTFGGALIRLVEMSAPAPERDPFLVERGWGPDRVTLSIDFARPHPEVLIEAEDAPGRGKDIGGGEMMSQPLLFARFTSAEPRPAEMGDRRDRTSIGSRTLLAVGRALAA